MRRFAASVVKVAKASAGSSSAGMAASMEACSCFSKNGSPPVQSGKSVSR
jgi:hypothetical protein